MTEQRIPVTVVNHVGVDMAVSPEVVWRTILDQYLTGEQFAAAGYQIEPLDDASTLIGGYRIRLEQDGAVVDDRIARITERDEAARRLSLHADYLSVPGGLQVFVTYQAQEVPGGARYALDCHTAMTVEVADAGDKAAIAAAALKMKTDFDTFLDDRLGALKTRLEGAAEGAA
jgi:hypothetical protein